MKKTSFFTLSKGRKYSDRIAKTDITQFSLPQHIDNKKANQ